MKAFGASVVMLAVLVTAVTVMVILTVKAGG